MAALTGPPETGREAACGTDGQAGPAAGLFTRCRCGGGDTWLELSINSPMDDGRGGMMQFRPARSLAGD